VAHDPNWRDPAHVLVSIFAGRQPKPFGAFLTRCGHQVVAALVVAKLASPYRAAVKANFQARLKLSRQANN